MMSERADQTAMRGREPEATDGADGVVGLAGVVSAGAHMDVHPDFVAQFEKMAARLPERPAVVSEGYPTLSYRELAVASNRIAHLLLDRTQDRRPVVVLGHKSPLMAASFLGCLKSGHAFVPVDTEMPPSRLLDIVSQLDDPLLLATEDIPSTVSDAIPEARLLDVRQQLEGLADERSPRGAVTDPALWVRGAQTQYIIFTSGSTGRPKGIEVTADNVAHLMAWLGTLPVIRQGRRAFLDQPPYSFDLSEYELVGALSTGGTLHAVGRETLAHMGLLFSNLAAAGIEVWVSTPSFADMCLADKSFSAELLPSVKLFLFCGEILHHNTARELRRRFPDAIIANTYGPTEATVAVTYCEMDDAMLDDPAPLPVGRPRPGVVLRVLDRETGESCEPGTVGEIVIAGPSVAKDYYRNPEKTRAAFFEMGSDEVGLRGNADLVSGARPAPTMRAYRTGDLGFLDADGMLHYGGRADSLIKLNGFRIELGDVEENIAQLPIVEQVAVVPVSRDGRITHLRACVALRPGARATLGEGASDFDVARHIKAALAEKLPPYMIPRKVVVMEALPMTPNGKIDRKLLAADRGARGAAAHDAAPAEPAASARPVAPVAHGEAVPDAPATVRTTAPTSRPRQTR